MRVTDEFVLFWGDDDVFSNFHPAPLTFSLGADIINVPTSEHGFMYMKAMFFGDVATANRILMAGTPLAAKKLGRGVEGFEPDMWDAISGEVMYNINKAKYAQNPALLVKLLLTLNRTIVEASPYDKIWGIGLGENDLDAEDRTMWKGQNKLGNVLTSLRNEFFKEGLR